MACTELDFNDVYRPHQKSVYSVESRWMLFARLLTTTDFDEYKRIYRALTTFKRDDKSAKKQAKKLKYIDTDSLKTSFYVIGDPDLDRRKLPNGHANKKVRCLELNLVYNSMREAASFWNFKATSMSDCLKRGYKIGGFHWEVVKE